MALIPEMTVEQLDLVRRLLVLRQERKVGIVLADEGRIYISTNQMDPWGDKCRFSWDQVRELVESLEVKIEKKEIGKEYGGIRAGNQSRTGS